LSQILIFIQKQPRVVEPIISIRDNLYHLRNLRSLSRHR
jgi:hypothetical protein